MAPMAALTVKTSPSAAGLTRRHAQQTATPAAPRRLALVVCASGAERDNPYHNRDTTKSRRSNPGGAKDANVIRQDKEDQYQYQQERLEWRRKNQFEGIEDREEPPHTNMAHDMSAERRGPDVEDTSGHGDTLKDLVDNITGKKKKKQEE